MSYCSLAEAKRELKAGTQADDDKVQDYVRQVSRRVDAIHNPGLIAMKFFEPTLASRTIEVRSKNVDTYYSNSLKLPGPLLSLTSLTIGGQDVTALVEAYPLGTSPITRLRLTDGSSWYSRCSYGRGPTYAVVTGLWGYHRDYAAAWVKYDDVTLTTFTPAETAFTVADVDGDDPYGLTPRFSPGQLLRIGGGTEIMTVSSTDTGANSVAVQRAQNGTALPATDYQVGDDVEVFQVEEPIRRVVARQAALFYARMGAFEAQQLDQAGITTYPTDLLTELRRTLNDYNYV